MRTINSRCVVNDEGCERNLHRTLARNPAFVTISPERTDKLAIVAAGPSVSDFLDEIQEFEHVWAINGAYNYLQDHEIIPTGFVGTDPLPGLAAYVTRPHPKTTFYLSVMCDEAVYDALKDHRVEVWFPRTDVNQLEVGLPPGTEVITGGTTALTRAPFLAKCLGFRDITLYGADSSFDFERRRRYAYQDGTYPEDSRAPITPVMIDGKGPFYTETPLMMQVSQMGAIFHSECGINLKVKCGGLMDAFLKAPVEWDAVDDVAKHLRD